MNTQITVGTSHALAGTWAGLLGAIGIAAAGALVTAALAFASTALVARRQRRDLIRASRLVIYAQLHRLAELSHGQLVYARDPARPRYIWLSVFHLNLPSASALDQVKLLSPREVYEVTSFYYAYQEQLGYLMGNARPLTREDVPGADPAFMPPGSKVEAPVFGYDLEDGARRDWLIDAISLIEFRARRARDAVATKMVASHRRESELRGMVERHVERDRLRSNAPQQLDTMSPAEK